jgi:hypothetical protein
MAKKVATTFTAPMINVDMSDDEDELPRLLNSCGA